MNRLTCKPDKVMENYYYETTEKTISEDRIAILNKLGQLEDIEDQLGVELTVLFSALKDGIWIKLGKRKIFYPFDLTDLCEEGITYFDTKKWEWHKYYFKDYKNTWALTKKELI